MILKNSFGGAVWVILIVFYFVFFSAAVTISDRIVIESDQNPIAGIVDSSGNFLQQFEPVCTTPRSQFDINTGELKELMWTSSSFQEYGIECRYSPGAESQNKCEDISGCSWDTVTSGFWFWESSYETCLGNINTSFYNISSIPYNEGAPLSLPGVTTPLIEVHENSRDLSGSFGSPCDHPKVITNEFLCTEVFACTWNEEGFEQMENVRGFLKSVTDILTLQYNFSTGHPLLNNILKFLFIILPMILLLMGVYYVLHPVK